MEYRSNEINELAKALAKAQGEMKFAVKDSVNPHFKSKYADLSSVIEAIKEPLSSNGLTFMQPIVTIDGQTFIETLLIHESGQWIKSLVPLHVPKDSRNAIQAFGASTTYLRRYSLSSLVGVAQDDDDGESAKQAQPQAQKPQKINESMVQWFIEQLAFYGEPVTTQFWDKLKSNNITKIEDLPLNWYEGTKRLLQEIVKENEVGGDDE